MEERSIAIIGGIVIFLALLSPFVIESRRKIVKLYSEAEGLYDVGDYTNAIEKYKAAEKESRKLFTKTDDIDKDFKTHINIKIARCYFDLGNSTKDQIFYSISLNIIDKNLKKAKDHKHIGELLYIRGIIYYKDGKFDVALSNLLKIEKLHLNSVWNPEILYTIGDILYQQEEYEEALVYILKLISDHPSSKFFNDKENEILYSIGDIYYQQEMYEKALVSFQKLIENHPSPEFSKKTNDRIDEINKLITPKPPEPIPDWEKEVKLTLDKANNLKQQEHFNEAMELYDTIVDQYPKSQFLSNAYEGRGDIYFSEMNNLQARENYEEAIYSTGDEIHKITLFQKYHETFLIPTPVPIQDETKPLLFDALLLRESGSYLEAAEQFAKLADKEKSPADRSFAFDQASFCYYEAYIRSNGSLFDSTVNALRGLINNHSESSYTIHAYYYLTLVFKGMVDKGGKDQFNSLRETVFDAERKFADTNDVVARDLLKQMQNIVSGLEKDLNSKVDAPDNTEVTPSETDHDSFSPLRRDEKVTQDGYTHFAKNELSKALKKAREALDINPNNQSAQQLKDKIRDEYTTIGLKAIEKLQFEEAISKFNQSLKIDSEFKIAYCNIGVVYVYLEKYEDAIIKFNRAIEIDQKFKEAFFNLGLAHFELRAYNKAKSAVDRALEIDSDYKSAKILQKSLQEKLGNR